MDIKYNSNLKNTRLPKVGDVWKHKTLDDNIYMRIDDNHGVKVFDDISVSDYFFSVNLKNGLIYMTYRNDSDNDIVILKAESSPIVFIEA